MAKYNPLRDYLASLPSEVRAVTISFHQIEELVGPLPRSARSSQAWWANTTDARVEARAWRAAGWHVQSADLTAERAVFARDVAGTTPTTASVTRSIPWAASDDNLPPGPPAEPEAVTAERHPWLRKVLSHRAMIGEFTVGAVTGIAAGVSGLVGITHLPWPTLVLLSLSVATAAFTITQAITSRNAADVSLRWWAGSTIIVLLVAAGAFCYHKFWDPSTHGKRTYQFIVNGNELNVIPLFGEAGGPQQLLATGDAGQNGLVGGQGYSFDCWVIGRDGQEWLRYERFGQTWWAPRKYLHPPFGESEPPVPHC